MAREIPAPEAELAASPVNESAGESTPRASQEQWEVIEFCVRLTRLFGVPKSVGEIFGFIFSSPTPVTFENVVTGLGISSGSASHGLRFLRQLGAIKLTYMARDRRDFYVAETSVRRLVAGYLNEHLTRGADENRQLLNGLRTKLHGAQEARAAHLLRCVETLMDWDRQGAVALKALMKALN